MASSVESFQGRSGFSTWVYRITKRRITDYYRKAARQVAQTAVEEEHELPASGNPIDNLQDELFVRQVLSSLPEIQQEVIQLRLIDGLSFDEVAERLGIKLGAAKLRFYRAVKACQEVLSSLN